MELGLDNMSKKLEENNKFNICIQQIRIYQTFIQVMGTRHQVKSVPTILELTVQ